MLSHMKWTDDQGRTCFFVNAGYPKDAVMFGHSASADDYPKCFNLGTVRIAAEFVGAVKCGAPEMWMYMPFVRSNYSLRQITSRAKLVEFRLIEIPEIMRPIISFWQNPWQ